MNSGDVVLSQGAIQLASGIIVAMSSALVGLFWLLYKSVSERAARAEKQSDTLLPALEKLADVVERSQRVA